MSPDLRARVVEMITDGASNTEIRDVLGVSLNAVAGIRYRDFESTMTQAEARKLGIAFGKQLAEAYDGMILRALAGGPLRRSNIKQELGVSDFGVIRSLRRLMATGAVVREGHRYRLIDAKAAA